MITLGIDIHALLVYEGQGDYGRVISPTPVPTVATLLDSDSQTQELPTSNDLGLANLLFREDFFDPVTRLRRGRLYARYYQEQPRQWRVRPHYALALEVNCYKDPEGLIRKSVYAFVEHSAHKLRKSSRLSLALGVQDFYTVWRVVGIERIHAGEDLLTLRAQNSLGTLSEINYSLVPGNAATRVREVIEKT